MALSPIERSRLFAAKNPGYQTDYFRKRYADPAYRMRYMVRRAEGRCKKSGVAFDPGLADLLASEPPTHCACCGIEFDYATVYDRGFRQNHAPSLDRVDNDRGYTADNVAVICTRCNLIKSDATAPELEAVARYIRRSLPAIRLVG